MANKKTEPFSRCVYKIQKRQSGSIFTVCDSDYSSCMLCCTLVLSR